LYRYLSWLSFGATLASGQTSMTNWHRFQFITPDASVVITAM